MQLLHNMENKTILLVNDKYRKMENFYFYDKNFDYPEKPLKYKHIRRISD